MRGRQPLVRVTQHDGDTHPDYIDTSLVRSYDSANTKYELMTPLQWEMNEVNGLNLLNNVTMRGHPVDWVFFFRWEIY